MDKAMGPFRDSGPQTDVSTEPPLIGPENMIYVGKFLV